MRYKLLEMVLASGGGGFSFLLKLPHSESYSYNPL